MKTRSFKKKRQLTLKEILMELYYDLYNLPKRSFDPLLPPPPPTQFAPPFFSPLKHFLKNSYTMFSYFALTYLHHTMNLIIKLNLPLKNEGTELFLICYADIWNNNCSDPLKEYWASKSSILSSWYGVHRGIGFTYALIPCLFFRSHGTNHCAV